MIGGMLKLVVLAALLGLCAAAVTPEEVFSWKEVSFAWPSQEAKDEAVKSGEYVSANNLPLGLEIWKDKLFVTVPRWKSGVASSLNYIPLNSKNKTDSLIPYPDWSANTIRKGEKPADNAVISTFRVAADACDRLWVMDTGVSDIWNTYKVISSPSIVIFDLNTDKLIRRYTLPSSVMKEHDSFFANIIVDVLPGKCDEAYAYLPDLGGYGLVVYSFAENESRRVKHNYFHFDPLQGNLTVGGVNFQWKDGVFGLALGPAGENGDRTVYFHALVSTTEFSVNNNVLKNRTLTQPDADNYEYFKIEGSKGEDSQTSSSVLDEKSNVLLYTQLLKDGIACWNTKKPLKPENTELVVQDHEKLIFANDIKIDKERNLWILSDKMPAFLYKGLNSDEVNYRILKISIDEAIKGTTCEA